MGLSKIDSLLSDKLPKGPAGRMIRFGLAALAVLLLFQLVVIPVRSYRKSLDSDIQRAQKDLSRLKGLAGQYAALKTSGSVAVRAAAGDQQAFYAFVEGLTRNLGLTANVDSIRPARRQLEDDLVEEEVHVRFKGLLQPQFIDFLYAAELSGQGVQIKQVGMRKDKERRLDVDVTLSLVHAGQ